MIKSNYFKPINGYFMVLTNELSINALEALNTSPSQQSLPPLPPSQQSLPPLPSKVYLPCPAKFTSPAQQTLPHLPSKVYKVKTSSLYKNCTSNNPHNLLIWLTAPQVEITSLVDILDMLDTKLYNKECHPLRPYSSPFDPHVAHTICSIGRPPIAAIGSLFGKGCSGTDANMCRWHSTQWQVVGTIRGGGW